MGVTKREILLTADPALTLRPASETETDSVLLRGRHPAPWPVYLLCSAAVEGL